MIPKKILMVMPSLPWPETGAEQADRAWGIRLLKELGYDVKVLAKWPTSKPSSLIAEARSEFNVEIKTIPYVFNDTKFLSLRKLRKCLYQLTHPSFWDGAALEYQEPLIKNEFKKILDDWSPEIVWFEYTYLWPLSQIAKKRGIKIITRSLNFEPDHFLQEDSDRLFKKIIYWAKLNSERKVIVDSSHIFAITPDEERHYRELGASHVSVLPLRGLNAFIGQNLKKTETIKSPVNVFFLGSSYNVSHNRRALEFLLLDIIPLANRLFPGCFIFHVFGAKVPSRLEIGLSSNVVIRGYVPNLTEALSTMDIALVPSLLGAGMQQKVFEPLTRGIPTITSSRGLAGYPFLEDKELLVANTTDEFVFNLGRLFKAPDLRFSLASRAVELSRQLFAKEIIKGIIEQSLK